MTQRLLLWERRKQEGLDSTGHSWWQCIPYLAFCFGQHSFSATGYLPGRALHPECTCKGQWNQDTGIIFLNFQCSTLPWTGPLFNKIFSWRGLFQIICLRLGMCRDIRTSQPQRGESQVGEEHSKQAQFISTEISHEILSKIWGKSKRFAWEIHKRFSVSSLVVPKMEEEFSGTVAVKNSKWHDKSW